MLGLVTEGLPGRTIILGAAMQSNPNRGHHYSYGSFKLWAVPSYWNTPGVPWCCGILVSDRWWSPSPRHVSGAFWPFNSFKFILWVLVDLKKISFQNEFRYFPISNTPWILLIAWLVLPRPPLCHGSCCTVRRLSWPIGGCSILAVSLPSVTWDYPTPWLWVSWIWASYAKRWWRNCPNPLRSQLPPTLISLVKLPLKDLLFWRIRGANLRFLITNHWMQIWTSHVDYGGNTCCWHFPNDNFLGLWY